MSTSSSDGTKQEQGQQITFEHRTEFAYEELLKCSVDTYVYGPLFVTRYGSYFLKWQLLVYPKTKNNKLGLHLKLIDRQQSISLTCELFCGKDKKVHRRSATGEFKDRCRGWSDFLPSVESLKKKKLVVDGFVSMGVNITLKVSDFDPLQLVPMQSVTPDSGHMAQKLFANVIAGNRRGSDFAILVGNDKTALYVHMVALQEVPFFDTLFGDSNGTGGGWKENNEGSMTMPTVDVDVVKEALRFVYLNEIGDNLTRFVPQLLDLANQWELSDLKKAIERQMIKKLMSDRLNYTLAADYLQLADMYHQGVLRRVAICRLVDIGPKFVADSPEGRNMDSHLKNEMTACAWSGSDGGVFV